MLFQVYCLRSNGGDYPWMVYILLSTFLFFNLNSRNNFRSVWLYFLYRLKRRFKYIVLYSVLHEFKLATMDFILLKVVRVLTMSRLDPLIFYVDPPEKWLINLKWISRQPILLHSISNFDDSFLLTIVCIVTSWYRISF